MPPETNPRLVFERLFGTADLSLDAETRERRARYRRSILDLVRGDTERLVGKLGASDRRKIDEYLFAVRDVEQRIEKAEQDNRELDPGIEKPAGIPIAFAEYLKLMFDLQVLAFMTDMTRIFSFKMGRDGSGRVYPGSGVSTAFHPASHHRDQEKRIEEFAQINKYHVGTVPYFLEKLKSTQEGEANLLEKTLVIYGSGRGGGPPSDTLLYAVDKATGRQVGAVKIPSKTSAVPMTFLHQGRQYIVFATGAGANTSLVALTLPRGGGRGGRGGGGGGGGRWGGAHAEARRVTTA